MPPGPFVAKVSGKDILAFAEQLDTILLGDFLTIDFLSATVPNAENDPALGLGIDLHSEVAAMPSTGHIKRPDRLFDSDDFGVKSVDFFVFGRRIHQMYRGRIAAFFEIEMDLSTGRSIESEFLDIQRRTRSSRQLDEDMARTIKCKGEFSKINDSEVLFARFGGSDGALFLRADSQFQSADRIGIPTHEDLGSELTRCFE